jgi:hypothetical protein
MSRYTPPSIDSYGGIEPFLDATKDKHNGNNSTMLKKYWNWGNGKHMNVTALAVLFGVSWPTMDGWLDRLHTEAGIVRPDKKLANTSDINDNEK